MEDREILEKELEAFKMIEENLDDKTVKFYKAIENILAENENLKQALIINKNLYEEVCNKNKELEIEKETLEEKIEYKNKDIRRQEKELARLQDELYSYKKDLEDVCNKNKELEEENKKLNNANKTYINAIQNITPVLTNEYVRKSLIKEIRDKVEIEDYYGLDNVLHDLNKVLGDEK